MVAPLASHKGNCNPCIQTAAAKILGGKAKRRQLRTPRGKRTIWRQLLKRVAQRKLNQPRGTHGRNNLAESARVFHVGDSGISEIGVIPNVEEVRCEA